MPTTLAPEQTAAALRQLHASLLDSWNRGDAAGFAALFTSEGNIVGFDGSPVDGAAAIQDHLQQIFTDHRPAAYVAIVREVRQFGSDTALLRAVAGMVPPGKTQVNPAVNAIQLVKVGAPIVPVTLSATLQGGNLSISWPASAAR